jgi:UDP-N-acetylmuramyl pentapeptide phosphotransferase/UDP-N-acetylglucosamine-1-phosphate transferase
MVPSRAVIFPAMRRTRIMTALLVVAITMLTVVPAAFARADGGEGFYGETNDKTITNAMFGVIIFFPTVIVVLSLIQWRLDKRKYARQNAAKRRAANSDWRGGW